MEMTANRRPLGGRRTIIEDALPASGGRVYGPSGAAAPLGVARSTLEPKIRSLGIGQEPFSLPSYEAVAVVRASV